MLPVQQLYHTKEVTGGTVREEHHNSSHTGGLYHEQSVIADNE